MRTLSEKLKQSDEGPRSLKEPLDLGEKVEPALDRFKAGKDKIAGIDDAVHALQATVRSSQTASGV